MELAFGSKELRRICESDIAATAALGDVVATALRRRLADLEAAPSLVDLPFGKPEVIDFQDTQVMSLVLTPDKQLLFVANHPKITQSGVDLDWSNVSRVQLLSIEAANG